ncbi:MAG: TonB-dependent receptor [Verrucomicrobia bacterium]|nr:TonB-dependent receptor [Verrucomicrobiota bacterium]
MKSAATTKPSDLPSFVRKVLALIAAAVLSPVLAFAQANTGTVQGRVYNPASQEYVRNAEVRLDGTTQITYTEGDGSFQFVGVRPGPASITVTYTGYNTVKDAFTVTAGQTAQRDLSLTSTAAAARKEGDVIQMSAFTVSSEREGNSKAIMAQRRSMGITTSVASDIFGDVTDGNVGEFLKYLPGVDLDYVESEARGPRLGGMDSQYVGVSFDGMRSASADANRGGGEASRATSFEGFSITAIESIEINRTTSPDSDADNPAGTINMRTRRAFDRKGRSFSYNTSLNFNDEEFTLKKTAGPRDGYSYKWKPNVQFDYAEAFFNQRFGVLLSASRANSYTEQYMVQQGYNRSPTTADPRPMVARQIFFKDGNKTILKDAMTLTADWKVTSRLVLSLTGLYTYTEGEFWNRSFTFVAANDNANVNNGRATVGGDGITTLIATRAASGSVNNVATLNNGDGSSAKLTYTRTLSPKFEYKGARWIIDGAMGYSRSVNNYESLERGFSNSEGGGVPSSWIATRPSPDSWEWTIRQTSGNDWFDARSFVSTDTRAGGTRVNNDNRTWITTIWSGQLNARWAVPFMERFPTSLKFGGKWSEESRNNNIVSDWDIWSYTGPGGNTMDVNPTTGANRIATVGGVVQAGNWAGVGPQFISPHWFDMGTTNGMAGGGVTNIRGALGMMPRINREAIAALFRAHPEQFVHTGTPENYYASFFANPRDYRQIVTSGYSQATVRLSSKLTLLGGVRLEKTENSAKNFDPLTRAQMLAAGYTVNAAGTSGGRALTLPGMIYQYTHNPRVTSRAVYQNYFPSVMFKYHLTPNFEFQLGWNKSISRPPIDNITGVWGIDEANQRVTAPNPDLQPEYHQKYQSRLAYYFRGKSPGQLTLDLTQSEARNFRQTFDYSAEDFGIEDPDFAAYTFRTTVNSTEKRRFRSMDLSYNQTLGFLPHELLRGLNYNVSYSRGYSDRRRANLAMHRVSSRLGYNYRRFNGTIGMVWRPDTPDSTTYGQYQGEITQFDVTLNWKLNRYATFYTQIRNLTGMPVRWYHTPPGQPEGQNRALRQMQEYGSNWVFGIKGLF